MTCVRVYKFVYCLSDAPFRYSLSHWLDIQFLNNCVLSDSFFLREISKGMIPGAYPISIAAWSSKIFHGGVGGGGSGAPKCLGAVVPEVEI